MMTSCVFPFASLWHLNPDKSPTFVAISPKIETNVEIEFAGQSLRD